MTRSRLFRFAAAIAGVVVAAGAAPVGAAPAEQAADPAGAAGPAAAQHTVTLITGDVVDVLRLPDGRRTASVRPDPARSEVDYAIRTVGGDVYVEPSDAAPLLADDRLDEELFNVTSLVDNGYDDAASPTLPLIVQSAQGAAATTFAAPPGATGGPYLASVNARVVHQDRRRAGELWTALSGPTTMAAAVTTVSLDRRITGSLTESVPQVGAPAAWAAGYDGTGVRVAVLDSGIDTAHPDLDQGKVVAEANFTSDPDTADHLGHGTHVASIIAGTGEAGPAGRRGVAPGANLLNAKVIGAANSGTASAVIQGLEWAAAQRADIANLSLGSEEPSDGSDPLVQAVDRISQSTGMLIVIAAGNLGEYGESTITSPGWADEALTVGAVDKNDVLADLSSRGPRLGDFAVKPDITAPGVDVVAARAAGTTLGPIVDDVYTRLSGTSMATPHVAGGAAILAQRYPELDNRQLKDALVANAALQPGPGVHEQGGGRLDIPRALTAPVRVSPGTLRLGAFPFPHDQQPPTTRTITYANSAAQDIVLGLDLAVTGRNGDPAPDGMFSLSATSVTVPAGGSAEVSLTIDPGVGGQGVYAGYLTATGGDTVLHTTVGAYVEPALFDVTVSGRTHAGRPADGNSRVELWSLRTGERIVREFPVDATPVSFRVPPGTYTLAAFLVDPAAAGGVAETAAVIDPELDVTADRDVVLDGTTATELVLNTHRPSELAVGNLGFHRAIEDRSLFSGTVFGAGTRAYAAPTAPVTTGEFEFLSSWELTEPAVTAALTRPTHTPLSPRAVPGTPPVLGRHVRELVDAGAGRPEDFARVPARGRIALVTAGALDLDQQVANATAAGAWGVLVAGDRPPAAAAGTIPVLAVERRTGVAIRAALRRGPVTVEVRGIATPSYAYDLVLPERGRIPPSLTYTVDRSNTAEVRATFTADATGAAGADDWVFGRPYPVSSSGRYREAPRPGRRTYYLSAGETTWRHVATSTRSLDGEFSSAPTSYRPGTVTSETWFGRPSRPGVAATSQTGVARTNDLIMMGIAPFSDSAGHPGFGTPGDAFTTRLYADDRLLRTFNGPPTGGFGAVPDPARYRLEFTARRATPWWTYSTETTTVWTFASSRPADGQTVRLPLLQVDYQLRLDELNRAPDRHTYTFTLEVGHIPGSSGPAVRDVRAWASFDDGASWHLIRVHRMHGNTWRAIVSHPRPGDGGNAVSLRVAATDPAGNSIDQTLLRAYGLPAR